MKATSLFFLICITYLFLSSCSNTSNTKEVPLADTLLSTDLVNNPSTLSSDTTFNQEIGHLLFSDTVYDFGQMEEGVIIQHEFMYKNVGKKEVIITDAVGSCGCTVPSYEKKPILPGEEGALTVTFNSAGKLGYNEKHVTITTNASPSTYRLTILSTVN